MNNMIYPHISVTKSGIAIVITLEGRVRAYEGEDVYLFFRKLQEEIEKAKEKAEFLLKLLSEEAQRDNEK